jgi:Protein of unknown function (DUF3443)
VRKLGLLFLLGNVMWFAACGGSGNNSNNSTVTGVTVSCSPTTITSGQTSQCTANVTGTGNFSSSVSWASSVGTISSSGLFTGPGTNTSLLVTITATSTQNTTIFGTTQVTVNPAMASNNVAPIVVDDGPAPSQFSTVNVAFVTIKVCQPGTNNCQTIDHVQVDTGSEGLRLLSTAGGGEFNPSGFTQETISGNPVDECLVFADGYVWGPVYSATVTVAGETATNIPIHSLIPASASPGVPQSCSNQNPSGGNGNEGGSLSDLGANGIIGVGPFQNDCGGYCVQDGSSCSGTMSAPCVYYQCPSSGCSPTNIATSQQVPNPVAAFTGDNNGVLIQLPNVANGGAQNVAGSLIFGIGTQSNNSISLAANVYPIPDNSSNAGEIITTYNGQTYPQSFLDSGSNGLFFLDSSTTGIPTCTGFTGSSDWYCPTNSPQSITVTNQGQDNNNNPDGPAVQVTFSIEDTSTLFNTNNTAFSTLGGPNPGAFDFGLTFFFGKNVFTGIDQMPVQNGPTGPFFAY